VNLRTKYENTIKVTDQKEKEEAKKELYNERSAMLVETNVYEQQLEDYNREVRGRIHYEYDCPLLSTFDLLEL